jgi:hypothetical protein
MLNIIPDTEILLTPQCPRIMIPADSNKFRFVNVILYTEHPMCREEEVPFEASSEKM